MKDNFENIDKSLDIERVDLDIQKIEVKSEKVESEIVSSPGSDEIKDYEYTRGHLYNLIEKAQQAVNEVLEVAQQSDSPRAYEVVFQGIKHAADVTDKLIDLQQKMQKLTGEEKKSPSTVNNTMFVGSTADLQKILKKGFFESK